MTTTTRAVWVLVFVNALWGISFPLIKNVQLLRPEAASAVGLAALLIAARFGLGFLYLLLRDLGRPIPLAAWWAGAAIGLAFAAGVLGQFIGLATIPASRSAFLTSLAVVFTPMLVGGLERRRPTGRMLLAVALAVVGAAILAHESGAQATPWNLGDLLTIGAALLFAVQIVLLDRAGKRLDPATLSPGMFLAAALFGATVFLVDAGASGVGLAPWWPWIVSTKWLCLLAFLTVFSTIMAFDLMNRHQPAVSAQQAAVIYTLEPVFATIAALFLPAWLAAWTGVLYPCEAFTWNLAIGGLCVAAANLAAAE